MFVGGYVVLAQGSYKAWPRRPRRLGVATGLSPTSDLGQARPFSPTVQTTEKCWCEYFWTATSNMYVDCCVVFAQGPYEARRRRLCVAMGPVLTSDLVKFWSGTLLLTVNI